MMNSTFLIGEDADAGMEVIEWVMAIGCRSNKMIKKKGQQGTQKSACPRSDRIGPTKALIATCPGWVW